MLAQAVVFHELGGPEVLRVETVDVPDPGPGEVRIRVEAFGFNRAEALFRHALYPDKKPVMPSRIGFEAVGRVESVGPGVEGFAIDSRVATLPMMELNKRGCYGELVTVPAVTVVEAAPELDILENASLWSAYMTAYVGLIDLVSIKEGDFVLVTAASSSCGPPAIQVANMMGAKPIAVTRSRAKAAAIEAMGPYATIVTEDEDLVGRIAQITGGRGVQVVFDPVGGPGVEKLIDVLANYGTFILYGLMDFTPALMPMTQMMTKNMTMSAYALYLFEKPERDARAIAFIRDGVTKGALKPIISKIFELREIVAAATYFDQMQQIGKVVVTVRSNMGPVTR